MLKFPPYKHTNIKPKNLVKKEYVYDNNYWHYELYDIKNKKGFKAGYMNAYPQHLAPDNKFNPSSNNRKSFHISFIRSLFEKKGYGQELLKLAKHESYAQGCKGNMHLTATSLYSGTKNMPHRMYRRFGFTSTDTDKLKAIDRWIKKDKRPSWAKIEPTHMYYTPKQPQLKSRLSKLINFLNIFKK